MYQAPCDNELVHSFPQPYPPPRWVTFGNSTFSAGISEIASRAVWACPGLWGW